MAPGYEHAKTTLILNLMSKTQDKRLQKKIDHAEFLWEEAQMKAAAMQQMLDIAVGEFEEHQAELDPEIVAKIQEQITIRKEDIKTYLMNEKDKFLERVRVDVDKTQ